MNETTVARRLKRLERALGVPLFARDRAGAYRLTDQAAPVLEHAETVEQDTVTLSERLGHSAAGVAGTVRISSVPVIINRVLLPRLDALCEKHPDLIVELVPESRNIDLTRREADLAIRFSRPRQGGLSTRAQKLGDMAFGIFCGSGVPADQQDQLDWITYDDAHTSLPQAQWTETLRQRVKQDRCGFRVADVDTALEAAANGAGKAVLPVMICDRDSRVQRVDAETYDLDMSREVWLLSHSDDEARRAVSAVKLWLTNLPWA